jgi:hypothetical protein
MKPTIAITMLFLIVTYAFPLHADVSASVNLPMQEIGTKALLPLGGAGGFVTPTFKFFDHDNLVGLQSGAPTINKPLEPALNSVPAGFTNPPLKDELKAVNIVATPTDKTVLIYTMIGTCPSCEGIIEKVKHQLPGLGWGSARILTVNIIVPAAR